MNTKVITRFDTGISASSKGEGANFNKNLDIFSDANSVSLNPALVKVSGTTVTGLVKDIAEATPYATDKYFYDDAGNIYKETSGGVWSIDRTGAAIANGAAGQGMSISMNSLFYASSTTVGRKFPLSSSPTYSDDFLSDGIINLDLVPTGTVSGNTYTVPVSLSETDANKITIIPTTDPLKTIAIFVQVKGTGDWTVTVHDSLNNIIGSATVVNASLTGASYNNFTPTTPTRITIGQEYHIHVTGTVADGSVRTGTASNLSTGDYKTYFGILVADTNYHPMINATNGVAPTVLIGNNRYIAELVPGVGSYSPNRIVLEDGFSVRSFYYENEFWVAECWKGTSIDGSEQGMLYYWNGTDRYYSYKKPVTSGMPNASVNFKNRILSVLGSKGTITLGTEPFLLIQDVPKLTRGKKIEVLPRAIDVWQNKAVIGIGANTDDATGVSQGVYEYGGTTDKSGSESLNFGYTISSGDVQGTTMKIGAVKAFGKDMYVSWKAQDGTYGVDKASKTGNPATTGSWESAIIDEMMVGRYIRNEPQREKLASKIMITYETLPAGCTVTPKYRINRLGSFTTSTVNGGIEGTTEAEIVINKRYKEIEIGFDLTATVNYPVITGVILVYDSIGDERFD